MSHTHQNGTAAQHELTAAANAPRVTQCKLVSESMPAKKKYGPNLLYASVVEPFDKVRDQIKKEMDGRWLGAMPVDMFFDKWAPATKEPLPELPNNPFVNLPCEQLGQKVPSMIPL